MLGRHQRALAAREQPHVGSRLNGEERWRVLRLHAEDQIPLAAPASETGISTRTLQRRHQLYQAGGTNALDPHTRADPGRRCTDPRNGHVYRGTSPEETQPSIPVEHANATRRLAWLPEGSAGLLLSPVDQSPAMINHCAASL
jgi:putative transposase